MEPTKLLLLFHSILSLVISVTVGGGTSPSADTCNFSYGSFPTSDGDTPYLNFSGHGKLSHGAVEVSTDTANYEAHKASWGWVVESRKLQFKQSRSRDVNSHTVAADTSASFSTTFKINLQVSKNNSGVGGGVAFMLPPQEQNVSGSNRTDRWLGLYNQSSIGQRSNNIIAIEFDTYKDEFDPDDNHVGLDLNDIRSFSTQPLLKYGINLRGSNSNLTFRIDYNGPGKQLDVFMAHADVSATSNKSDVKNVLHVTDINLGNYTSDVVYAGFAASSGDAVDLHFLLSWNFSMECFPTLTNNHLGTIKIGLIIATAAAVLIGIIAITLFIRRRKQKRKATDQLSELIPR